MIPKTGPRGATSRWSSRAATYHSIRGVPQADRRPSLGAGPRQSQTERRRKAGPSSSRCAVSPKTISLELSIRGRLKISRGKRPHDMCGAALRWPRRPGDFERPVLERLTRRPYRDIAFRRKVREAYDYRCAMSGLKLRNGGGPPGGASSPYPPRRTQGQRFRKKRAGAVRHIALDVRSWADLGRR